jgi:hypothetical protein
VETSSSPLGIIIRPSLEWWPADRPNETFLSASISFNVHVADSADPEHQASIVGATLQGTPIANQTEGDGTRYSYVQVRTHADELDEYLRIYDSRDEKDPESDSYDPFDSVVFASLDVIHVQMFIEIADNFDLRQATIPSVQQSFEIDASIDVQIPGDFNGNGIVDTADYTVWRDTMNDTPRYTEWQSNFGETSGGGSNALSVAEPSSIALILIGAMATLCCFFDQPARYGMVPHARPQQISTFNF